MIYEWTRRQSSVFAVVLGVVGVAAGQCQPAGAASQQSGPAFPR